MKAVKTIVAAALCLISVLAQGQQKGHFLIGGETAWIFGNNTQERPSILMYSLGAGISYNINSSFRANGGLGGFRNVLSKYNGRFQPETGNGPMLWIGADYLVPARKAVRPSVSLNAGYRRPVPRSGSSGRAYGAYLKAGIGADIQFGETLVNISLTGQLTQSLSFAAGINLQLMLP